MTFCVIFSFLHPSELDKNDIPSSTANPISDIIEQNMVEEREMKSPRALKQTSL